MIESRPTKELRSGIGNVENIDESGIYFRFGKTTKATIETFKDGIFIDQEFETSPYTHILLDLDLEVMAIAKKAKLAPKIAGIASRLSRLLVMSPNLVGQGADIEIAELQDPEDFLEHLRQAYQISKFSIGFSRPNPFDVNRDFVKPLQKCLADSDGEKGKVDLKGESLKAEILEELARSAAATGDDASARLKIDQQARPVIRHLKGKAVMVSEQNVDLLEQKRGILQHVREMYRRLRG
jgi:hypothetical protein